MKYALISEEQISQCVDEINKSIERADGWTTVGQHNVLALLKSLKPSEPAVWKTSHNGWSYEKPLFHATPFYALDKEQA